MWRKIVYNYKTVTYWMWINFTDLRTAGRPVSTPWSHPYNYKADRVCMLYSILGFCTWTPLSDKLNRPIQYSKIVAMQCSIQNWTSDVTLTFMITIHQQSMSYWEEKEGRKKYSGERKRNYDKFDKKEVCHISSTADFFIFFKWTAFHAGWT